MFTISKRFDFSASHQLTGLPEDHPCSRLHGHNYQVVMTLADDNLNPVGFVKDYRELSEVKKWIDETLEHRHLNDIFPFNPSAENLAKRLYDIFYLELNQLKSVTVKETDKTSATYEP